uniref:(northern house mosquito) hypothetical protein n=1 Tax=Culex pipiens TaxID=7175 RepID=A0A8D8B7B9_CULPI
MEITIDLLVEIDKLVQLIESPIFACTYPFLTCNFTQSQLTFNTSNSPPPRAGLPRQRQRRRAAPLPRPVRHPDAAAPDGGVQPAAEPAPVRTQLLGPTGDGEFQVVQRKPKQDQLWRAVCAL